MESGGQCSKEFMPASRVCLFLLRTYTWLAGFSPTNTTARPGVMPWACFELGHLAGDPGAQAGGERLSVDGGAAFISLLTHFFLDRLFRFGAVYYPVATHFTVAMVGCRFSTIRCRRYASRWAGRCLRLARSIACRGNGFFWSELWSTIVNDEAEIEDGEEEELDLSTLDDDDLVKQMHDDLYDGLREEIVEATNILLGRGWQPKRLLDEALVEGMRIVGIDFRDGILFVPEVLLAANAMKGGMEILRPLLAETGAPPIGKMVIGTVKGDIHDIGKNLVGMMMEGAGFEVINIGINNSGGDLPRSHRTSTSPTSSVCRRC